ncbi:MAG: hypothetical protein H0W18_07100, partial [Acidobacteria bacterium]|nr:hypothetical protein [Acidobacteriota bacterium]
SSGNCFDLVLFLNGIPVATGELKTDFTQTVRDAIDQYRFNRHPRPKGRFQALASHDNASCPQASRRYRLGSLERSPLS